MLNQEQTLDYIRKAKSGDEKAKEILLKNNIPLLKSIINRFRNKGIEYDDLYQIASIGFLKAISNFDESFNVKFSTYSVPMIIGELKRYMRDNGAIKVSRSLKILANKINKFIDAFSLTHSTSPTIEYISKEFNVSEEDVVFAIDSTRMPLSIYDKYEEDDDAPELIDKIGYNDTEEKLVDKIQLFQIIDNLEPREKKIVMMRYFRDKTQGEIAENLGVSQVQVSRLESKIIEKIRLKYKD